MGLFYGISECLNTIEKMIKGLENLVAAWEVYLERDRNHARFRLCRSNVQHHT